MPTNESPWLDIPLTSPPLSVRAHRCLTAAGYRTLADVSKAPPSKWHKIPGIGPESAREVIRHLKAAKRSEAAKLLATGLSLRQVAAAAGVSGECVRKWAKGA